MVAVIHSIWWFEELWAISTASHQDTYDGKEKYFEKVLVIKLSRYQWKMEVWWTFLISLADRYLRLYTICNRRGDREWLRWRNFLFDRAQFILAGTQLSPPSCLVVKFWVVGRSLSSQYCTNYRKVDRTWPPKLALPLPLQRQPRAKTLSPGRLALPERFIFARFLTSTLCDETFLYGYSWNGLSTQSFILLNFAFCDWASKGSNSWV